MADPIYEFDTRANDPVNRVLSEQHTLVLNGSRIIVPDRGLYYVHTVIVRDGSGTELNGPDHETPDWRPVKNEPFITARTTFDVAGGIVMENPSVTGIVTLELQYVGGREGEYAQVLDELRDAILKNQEGVSYEKVIGLPESYTPAAHNHDLSDITHLNALVDPFVELGKAITLKRAPLESGQTLNHKILSMLQLLGSLRNDLNKLSVNTYQTTVNKDDIAILNAMLDTVLGSPTNNTLIPKTNNTESETPTLSDFLGSIDDSIGTGFLERIFTDSGQNPTSINRYTLLESLNYLMKNIVGLISEASVTTFTGSSKPTLWEVIGDFKQVTNDSGDFAPVYILLDELYTKISDNDIDISNIISDVANKAYSSNVPTNAQFNTLVETVGDIREDIEGNPLNMSAPVYMDGNPIGLGPGSSRLLLDSSGLLIYNGKVMATTVDVTNTVTFTNQYNSTANADSRTAMSPLGVQGAIGWLQGIIDAQLSTINDDISDVDDRVDTANTQITINKNNLTTYQTSTDGKFDTVDSNISNLTSQTGSALTAVNNNLTALIDENNQRISEIDTLTEAEEVRAETDRVNKLSVNVVSTRDRRAINMVNPAWFGLNFANSTLINLGTHQLVSGPIKSTSGAVLNETSDKFVVEQTFSSGFYNEYGPITIIAGSNNNALGGGEFRLAVPTETNLSTSLTVGFVVKPSATAIDNWFTGTSRALTTTPSSTDSWIVFNTKNTTRARLGFSESLAPLLQNDITSTSDGYFVTVYVGTNEYPIFLLKYDSNYPDGTNPGKYYQFDRGVYEKMLEDNGGSIIGLTTRVYYAVGFVSRDAVEAAA